MRLLNEKQFAKWECIRAAGRTRDIVRHGVIGWGLHMAVLFPILMSWSEPGVAYFAERPAIGFVVFPLCGFLCGAMMWRISEEVCAKSRGAASVLGAAA